MLNNRDYNNLWTATLGLPIQNIPCYYQYLQREVYYQDYLDLFCCPKNGHPTYERISVNGHHTVLIPNLQLNPNGAYTVIDSTGQVRLIVDYDFPYYGELCKNRDIKYILIGEAPPATGSYIYKDAKGSYITAPLSAFNINTKKLSRLNRLIDFAKNGYLLLDLFPFAIDFESTLGIHIRNILLNNNTNNGLNSLMNSLFNKTRNLICLHHYWDFCLVAPKRTSLAVLNWLETNNNYQFNGNTTLHRLDLIYSPDFIDSKRKVHSDHTVNPTPLNWPISHLTKRAKFTVAIGGTGPNAQLIKRAFNLP
jgi:hypothetical protein